MWRLRDEVPGIAVRSTYIVGFPGETQADFEALLAFSAKYRFERLGVFTWSPEEGTPSHDLPGRVDPEVAEARRAELMALQKTILDEHNRARVGTTLRVLIDGRLDKTSVVGRTTADAPEIDCRVVIKDKDLTAGAFVDARITGVDDYDLIGEVAKGRAR